MDKSKVYTKLVGKHYSPMVIRKITHFSFPIYVAIITDDDLSELDHKIMGYMNANKESSWVNDIQKMRNLAGGLTEFLTEEYASCEGCAVIFYVDKMFVSSLHGDFMTHGMCRLELFSLLNMSTGV